jgi:hypothetical protein
VTLGVLGDQFGAIDHDYHQVERRKSRLS